MCRSMETARESVSETLLVREDVQSMLTPAGYPALPGAGRRAETDAKHGCHPPDTTTVFTRHWLTWSYP